MTRKDYQLIADAIKRQRGFRNTDKETIDSFVQTIAQTLKDDNNNFNWHRFENACK